MQVVALPADGRSVRWRWVPPTAVDGHGAEGSENIPPTSPRSHRPFFPSSICADSDGRVFVADLYNERVYMLDGNGEGGELVADTCQQRCSRSSFDFPSPLLTRRTGLKGGPLSLAVDESRQHLYVADEERTVRVFCYAAAVAAAANAALRQRIPSDSRDEVEGRVLHQRQPQQQQCSLGSRVMSAVDRPFSYCADDAEEY